MTVADTEPQLEASPLGWLSPHSSDCHLPELDYPQCWVLFVGSRKVRGWNSLQHLWARDRHESVSLWARQQVSARSRPKCLASLRAVQYNCLGCSRASHLRIFGKGRDPGGLLCWRWVSSCWASTWVPRWGLVRSTWALQVWESHATGIVSCSQSVQRSDAVHSTEGANSPSQQADLKSLVEFWIVGHLQHFSAIKKNKLSVLLHWAHHHLKWVTMTATAIIIAVSVWWLL